jgi:orotate phosphoribosyltransferase
MASGLSKWKSIEKLKGEGISIQRIIVFFDRQQGGSELLQEEGYQVYSIFKLLDVIAFYLEKGLISPATHSQIHEFLHSHRFERPLWRD